MRTLRTLFLIAASSCALLLAATAQIPESCPRVVDQPGWSSATYGITQDIGLVINQMFVTQGSPGKAACVSLYGLPSPPANHSLGDYEGVYWANTSPWLGQHRSNEDRLAAQRGNRHICSMGHSKSTDLHHGDESVE